MGGNYDDKDVPGVDKLAVILLVLYVVGARSVKCCLMLQTLHTVNSVLLARLCVTTHPKDGHLLTREYERDTAVWMLKDEDSR